MINKFKPAYPNNAVRIGRVNCEEQQKLTQKYRISKYPTIKVFRHGVEMRSEYRGTRTAGDFMVSTYFIFYGTFLEHSRKNLFQGIHQRADEGPGSKVRVT